MEGVEISGKSWNIWSNQEYLEEVAIYEVTRNTGMKQKYLEEVGIQGMSRNTEKK